MEESSLSKATNYEEIGEYWDTHDLTDFDKDGHEVQFEVICAIPIDKELFKAIETEARKRGVQTETLANLWLQQKLAEQEHSTG